MRERDRLLNKEAWHRPWIRRVEHLFKRLSFGVVGSILRPPQVSAPLSLDNVNSVLILRYDALGDLVLTTPILRILKSRKPSLTIGVAGSKKNLDLIRADPDVDDTYSFIQKSNEDMWSEIKRARTVKWDLIINLVYNDKTRAAIIAWLIDPHAVRATAVREPLAQYRNIYSIVAQRPALRPPTPMLEQALLTLTAALDLHIEPDEMHSSLKLDHAIVHEVNTQVTRLLKVASTSRIVHINTTSSEEFREWGYDNAWELSQRLTDQLADVEAIWTGSPERVSELRQFFESHNHPRITFFETPTPTHLASLIGEVELVISPDTSVVHIASAQRKPIVGLYMEANEFLPYGVPNIVLMPTKDQPLKTISVESVLKATTTLLTKTH